jgi:ATP-dependent DNA helicase PIF1
MDALAGTGSTPSQDTSKPKPQALTDSKGVNKRPSTGNVEDIMNDIEPAPKKARKLPDAWSGDNLSAPGFDQRSHSGNATARMRVEKQTMLVKDESPNSKKSSLVCLSQEQTNILKLVEEGTSVFYTGSAGMHISYDLYLSCMY